MLCFTDIFQFWMKGHENIGHQNETHMSFIGHLENNSLNTFSERKNLLTWTCCLTCCCCVAELSDMQNYIAVISVFQCLMKCVLLIGISVLGTICCFQLQDYDRSYGKIKCKQTRKKGRKQDSELANGIAWPRNFSLFFLSPILHLQFDKR